MSAAGRSRSGSAEASDRRSVPQARRRTEPTSREIEEGNELFALLARRRSSRPRETKTGRGAGAEGKADAPSGRSGTAVRRSRRLEHLLAFVERIVARVEKGARVVVRYPGIPWFAMVPISDLPLLERLDGARPRGGRQKRRASISVEELARRLEEWLESKARARQGPSGKPGRTTTRKAER